jgi:ABC-2 type transport system ATP-binding protein
MYSTTATPSRSSSEAAVGGGYLTPQACLEWIDVTKDYSGSRVSGGKVRALDGVSLRLDSGEALGLAGPNRAGKTTLLKLALSLCRPSSGQILRYGIPAEARATLTRVGYVHEAPAFPSYLNAGDLLDFYGALSGLTRGSRRRVIPELLERVGLADRRRAPISTYSKGMLQRLGLAQAMVNRPQLLVLDEPDAGLDLPGRDLIVDLVAEHRQRGGSLLLVSHQARAIENLCKRVVVLVAGKIVHDGPVAALAGTSNDLESAIRALYRSGKAS